MDAISLLDSSEELDEIPLSVNESFEELEQSILSILAEDELDDTILPDDTLRCDSPIDGIVLPDSSTSSDSFALSNNETLPQDLISSPQKFNIKRNLDNVISPAPICKKLKAKHPLVIDNVSDIKSLKAKCNIFNQKENLSNDVAVPFCTGIYKNNFQNGKMCNNALGDIINTISSPLKPGRSNFPKSPVKINKKNNENILLNSIVKLNMQHSENSTDSCPKKIVPFEKLNNDLSSDCSPFTLNVVSDLVDQSSVQTSYKVLNAESVYTNASNSTLPQLSSSDNYIQNCDTYEKVQNNSIQSVQKSNIKISDNTHRSQENTIKNEDELLSLEKIQNNSIESVQKSNIKISNDNTQGQENAIENEDDLLLLANNDVEVVVEDELDDSLLFDDNATDICRSDAGTCDSAIIIDEWTQSDNPSVVDLSQRTAFNNKNIAICTVDNLVKTEELTCKEKELISVPEQSSNSQPLSDKETEKAIDSTDEKPVKQYLLPFKSDDPEENKDIEDPEWDSMRNLTTDEERYKDVRLRWKSKLPPNPNRDLTYHSFRKRKTQNETKSPSVTNTKRGKKRAADQPLLKPNAKRARTKTVSCTFMIDNKISDVKRQYSKESKAVEDEFIRDSHMSDYGWRNFAMPNSCYYNNFEMQRRERLGSLLSRKQDELHLQLDSLEKVRKEINQVCVFYKGLREKSNSKGDPTRLTEKQTNELIEIENVYSQFALHYNY